MGVSLRGYDIDIYPLKHKSCYSLMWRKVDKIHSISYSLLKKARKFGLDNSIDQKLFSRQWILKNSKISEIQYH